MTGPAVEDIDETIRVALQSGPPPPYDELVALEQTLLLIIAELYAAVDERPPAGADDGQVRNRLNSIRYQTAIGLGNGLVSAHMQVRCLARDCQWLVEQHAAGAHS
ncbi:DUF6415 family natural product biosynthesis protein [Streptomyces sp. NRRL S-1813]|uniref:DUF6415 family natural product biosynthesis protein n=1 Tax=Streptomyces sp. NRRL S-1813 TaxID=1463888 RepID=UPI0004CB1BAC|nr:DUF6415 family natural product biosynthesis protein [Streptomyces sp. NRRL S-1813]